MSIRMVEDEDEDDNDGRKRQHLVPRHDPPTASVLHTMLHTVLWHCTSHPPHWCCTLRRQLHTSVLHAHNPQDRYCCTQLHRYCTLYFSTSQCTLYLSTAQCTLYFSTAHMYTTHLAWILHTQTARKPRPPRHMRHSAD